jgi:hypothetical protein
VVGDLPPVNVCPARIFTLSLKIKKISENDRYHIACYEAVNVSDKPAIVLVHLIALPCPWCIPHRPFIGPNTAP